MNVLRKISFLFVLVLLGCNPDSNETQELNQELVFGNAAAVESVKSTTEFRSQLNKSNSFKGTISAMLVEACDADCDIKVSIFDGRDIYVNCNGFDFDIEKYVDQSIQITGEAHKDPNTNRVVFDASGIRVN